MWHERAGDDDEGLTFRERRAMLTLIFSTALSSASGAGTQPAAARGNGGQREGLVQLVTGGVSWVWACDLRLALVILPAKVDKYFSTKLTPNSKKLSGFGFLPSIRAQRDISRRLTTKPRVFLTFVTPRTSRGVSVPTA